MVDSHEISDAAIGLARRKILEALHAPGVVAARYLADRKRIEIDLNSGWSIQVPRSFSVLTVKGGTAACS